MTAVAAAPATWTEDAVLRALRAHFKDQWACVPQVTVAMRDLDDRADLSGWERGRRREDKADWTDRRIDMLLIRPARRKGIGPVETLAVEVKVTRADFLSDVRNPAKQAPWRAAATRFAYAVPAGLVQPEEVPDGCGLIYVTDSPGYRSTAVAAAEWKRRAPYAPGHAPQLPRRVHTGLAYRLGDLEAQTRGWWRTDDDDPQALRARAEAAEARATKAERARITAEGKASAWKKAHALATPQGHPCRWCGQPVKPLHPSAGGFKGWRHRDAAQDEPCRALEVALKETRAREDYDAADEPTRRKRLRSAQEWQRVELIDAEPWRAFLGPDGSYLKPGHVQVDGPLPADVQPEGV